MEIDNLKPVRFETSIVYGDILRYDILGLNMFIENYKIFKELKCYQDSLLDLFIDKYTYGRSVTCLVGSLAIINYCNELGKSDENSWDTIIHHNGWTNEKYKYVKSCFQNSEFNDYKTYGNKRIMLRVEDQNIFLHIRRSFMRWDALGIIIGSSAEDNMESMSDLFNRESCEEDIIRNTLKISSSVIITSFDGQILIIFTSKEDKSELNKIEISTLAASEYILSNSWYAANRDKIGWRNEFYGCLMHESIQ
jgi:hypothetical protein